MKTAKQTLDACNALAHVFHHDIDRILDFASVVAETIPTHYGPKSLKPPPDFRKQDYADMLNIANTLFDFLESKANKKEGILDVTDQSVKSFKSIMKAIDREQKMPSMANEMALVYMLSTLEAFIKAYVQEAPSPPRKPFSGTSFGSLIRYLKDYMAIDLQKHFIQYSVLQEALAYRNVYVHNHGKPDERFRRQVNLFNLCGDRLTCSFDFLKRASECVHSLIDFISFNLGRLYLRQIASPEKKAPLSVCDPWGWKGVRHAEETIGKTMVVFVAFCSNSGEEPEKFLTYGKITAVADDGTLTLTTPLGEPFAVPFDPKSIKLAPPGIYTATQLGSTIVAPDLLTSWQARAPDDDPAKVGECKRYGFPGAQQTGMANKTDAGDA